MHRLFRSTLLILLILVGLVLTGSAHAQTLQLLYNFEGASAASIPDASGNGRNGSLATGSTLTSDARTGFVAGQTFTSSNGINVAPFDLGSQFSIFTFVKLPNVTTPGDIQTIFANSSGGYNTDGLRLFVNSFQSSDQRIIIEAGDGTASAVVRTGTGVFPSDVQYHSLAFVIDRTLGNGTIYLDGLQVATGSGLPAFATNTGSQTIGVFVGGGMYQAPTNATFDEFRIYSGLLSAQQIRELNNLPATVPEPGSGLLLVCMGGGGISLLLRRRRRFQPSCVSTPK